MKAVIKYKPKVEVKDATNKPYIQQLDNIFYNADILKIVAYTNLFHITYNFLSINIYFSRRKLASKHRT